MFGGFEARVRERASSVILQFHTRKAEALVAYLAMRGDSRQRRAHLSELLWGDVPDAQARHSLRQTLTDIRTVLEPRARDLLETSEDTVAFAPGRIWVDARAFERLLRHNTPRSIAMACLLYRGDVLEGVNTREVAFESWANVERFAFRQRAIEAYERWMHSLAAAGEITEALQAGLRLASMDPLSEPAHRALMSLYLQRGQLAAALRQYELCVALLARELGIAPEAETTELWHQILAARAQSAAQPLRESRSPRPGIATSTPNPAAGPEVAPDRRPNASPRKRRRRKGHR